MYAMLTSTRPQSSFSSVNDAAHLIHDRRLYLPANLLSMVQSIEQFRRINMLADGQIEMAIVKDLSSMTGHTGRGQSYVQDIVPRYIVTAEDFGSASGRVIRTNTY